MLSDYTNRPLNAGAFSDRPFTFLDQDAQNDLANITAIALMENGDRAARENWQNRRLTHVLRHAHGRSPFWRRRFPSRPINHSVMKYLPVQTRQDIAEQTAHEGTLMATDGNAAVNFYSTTGSTGTPVKVFATAENGYYTVIRSLAQYFMAGLPLTESRTQIVLATTRDELSSSRGAETAASWAGPLSKVFSNGPNRNVTYRFDPAELVRELARQPVGYLVCPSRYLDILIAHGGLDLIKSLGITAWMHGFDARDPQLVAQLAGIGVRSLSNYSAGEVGPIAFECPARQDHFHVAHSNVVVEADEGLTVSRDGMTLHRLLVTHLHGYATPVIRYDVGDFGRLHARCPCGHDGSTISDIFGRGKHFLRHPDGRHLPFYVAPRTLMDILPYEEMRVRQETVDTIDVDVGGRDAVSDTEAEALTAYVIKATDPAFRVRINPVKKIDWSNNPKRLFFVSTVG